MKTGHYTTKVNNTRNSTCIRDRPRKRSVEKKRIGKGTWQCKWNTSMGFVSKWKEM